eukprot:scaffold99007_cov63-Phaeocystis_antarctica.AAC.1
MQSARAPYLERAKVYARSGTRSSTASAPIASSRACSASTSVLAVPASVVCLPSAHSHSRAVRRCAISASLSGAWGGAWAGGGTWAGGAWAGGTLAGGVWAGGAWAGGGGLVGAVGGGPAGRATCPAVRSCSSPSTRRSRRPSTWPRSSHAPKTSSMSMAPTGARCSPCTSARAPS